jgi:hypothetical protein
MDFTERFSEVCYPLAFEHADSMAIGTHDTGYLLMENYHRWAAVLDVGDMAATATLDFSVRQSIDAAGTTTAAITGKAATQLTQAGGDGNECVVIEGRTEELNIAGGYEYIYARVIVAAAAVEYSLIVYGICSRYEPVPTTNWSEIVD